MATKEERRAALAALREANQRKAAKKKQGNKPKLVTYKGDESRGIKGGTYKSNKPRKLLPNEKKAIAKKQREATANRTTSGTGNAALDKINSQAKKQQKRAAKAVAGNVAGFVDKKTGVTRSKTIGANSSKTKSAFENQLSGKGKTEAVRTATAESRAFTNTKRGMERAEAWLKLGDENLSEKERNRLEKIANGDGG